MYYSIQRNESLVPVNQRNDLFYAKWLKKKFPSLEGVIGIDDSEAVKFREELYQKKTN